MKRFLFISSLIVTLLSTLTSYAQINRKPIPSELYYFYNMKVNNSTVSGTYANSKIDTSESVILGGVSHLTFTLTVGDTATLDYYIDYKVIGTNTSWTNALTDSLINTGATSNTGKTQEYLFRNYVTEKYGGLVYQVRTRKAFHSSGNGVSSATYTERVNYRR